MLKIWYYGGVKYMEDAPAYFDNHTFLRHAQMPYEQFFRDLVVVIVDEDHGLSLSCESAENNMLKIWYYGGVKYMEDAPAYFDNVYEDEWIEDTLVKAMIEDVDHSRVISAHNIESPVFGAITPQGLSGGVKVLILMLKDDSFVYNMSNCGDNCAKWILKIAETKTGLPANSQIFIQHVQKSSFACSAVPF